jgi:titin
VTIDGYSQPGASAATSTTDAVLKIELSGAFAGTSGKGLVITTANSTVKGLAINRWDQPLIITGSGATGNRIEGNYIGTDVTGTQDLGNTNNGVLVFDAPNNTVGGTTAAARNIISGSDNAWGVRIANSGATGNQVQGNYIGTDKTGTADLGNKYDGVLVFDASNNTVGGTTAGARNIILGNDRHGVFISGFAGATGNQVQGNYIGTDKTGTADLGNLGNGVELGGSEGGAPSVPITNNIVGGTTAAARNVISGNDQSGVHMRDSYGDPGETRANKVQGNYIGTDKTGTADLGNLGNGVSIERTRGNTIGGTTAAARNVISGNDQSGVSIFSDMDNEVQGNYIGTDVTGKVDLGNSSNGVGLSRSDDNTVGGTTAGARNIISGNDEHGVSIFGAGGNKVMGNYIGTDASGTLDRGNSGDGVRVPGAAGNTIGGTEAGAGNIIFGNGGIGVHISPSAQFSDPVNRILSNSIGDNTGLGIDLDPTPGVTANTDDDSWQDFPEFSSVKKIDTKTTIKGTLTSNSTETTFIIQFFSSPAADPTGFGEGKTFLGQREVRTDGGGNASFKFTTKSKKIPKRGVVTATATNQTTGDTSEFSEAKPVK